MPTLEWIGKEKVINHHQQVPYRVLEEKYTYNAEKSDNMIIRGDNLEALKALLPKYESRIKCIYIDPPYNTAKSSDKNKAWVYSDSVDHPKIKAWIGLAVGDEGEDFSRHDKWLCMMYPRLKLLHRLLHRNGAIFISIDDNEYARLKDICDEIFGISNHIKTFIWYTTGHTDNQDYVTGVHEYILCYAKNKAELFYNSVVDPNIADDSKILRSFAENSITKNGYKNPPSFVTLPVGFPCEIEELELEKDENLDDFVLAVEEQGYITRELTKQFGMRYPVRRNKMCVKDYGLKTECSVYSGWMNIEKLKAFIANNCQPIEDGDTLLRFYLSKNGVIYYYRSGRDSHYIQTVLENMGTTETNKYMLEKMGITFDYPKPVDLIKYLISFFVQPGDFVLDSFAGSGTTAHAVLQINAKTPLRFILVEMEDYADSTTAERVKKAISGYGDTLGTGGDFTFYDLGQALLLPDGNLNEEIDTAKIREYIWYMETKTPLAEAASENPYYLGTNNNTCYYFFYEKDRITTLGYEFLATIKEKSEGYLIYADLCTIPDEELKRYNITFKKIPRDIARL